MESRRNRLLFATQKFLFISRCKQEFLLYLSKGTRPIYHVHNFFSSSRNIAHIPQEMGARSNNKKFLIYFYRT